MFWGLVVSGGAILLAVTESLPLYLQKLSLLGFFTGYLFGLIAILTFLIAIVIHLFGKYENFWQSYTPINFGLTGLGLAFVCLTISKGIPWLAFFISLLLALLIASIRLYKFKALALILMLHIVILMKGYYIAFDWDMGVGTFFLFIFVALLSSLREILSKRGKDQSNPTLQGTC